MKLISMKNVSIKGVVLSDLNDEESEVLFRQAEYCQAMTDADRKTLEEIVMMDKRFVHMNGKVQTREEYFNDICRGNLKYSFIEIVNPVIHVYEEYASIEYISVLHADAYGATVSIVSAVYIGLKRFMTAGMHVIRQSFRKVKIHCTKGMLCTV